MTTILSMIAFILINRSETKSTKEGGYTSCDPDEKRHYGRMSGLTKCIDFKRKNRVA